MSPSDVRAIGCFFITVAELPNLMPPRSTRLPLDTKYLRKNTNYSVPSGTPEGRTQKSTFFIRITNERIKLTSFLIISYITFDTTSEYNIYYYNSRM